MKKLVLLGSSAEHLQVLQDLAKAPVPQTHVTLVCARARHVHSRLLSHCVAGLHSVDEISVPLAPWAKMAGATLIESDVLVLDAQHQQLSLTNGQDLRYDALSIAANGVADRKAIDGADAHALFVRSIDQFLESWESLVAMHLKSGTRKALSLVVVGDGAQAFELSLAFQKRLGRRVRVALVTGGDRLLPGHPAPFQRSAKKLLLQGGITVFNENCLSITSDQMQLSRNLRLACDLAVMAVEPRPAMWLCGAELALDAHGFISTAPTLQSSSHPHIFAVGELVSQAPKVQSSRSCYGFQTTAPSLLTRNLCQFLAGNSLVAGQFTLPGWHALALADGRALGRLGKWSWAGYGVGWLKAYADRQFLQRFSVVQTPISRFAESVCFENQKNPT
jgi:NADH dehydrogenase FAD-containing subunit